MNQKELFDKIVEDSEVVITTCGNCGYIVLVDLTGDLEDTHCPHCEFYGEFCDFPDLYY